MRDKKKRVLQIYIERGRLHVEVNLEMGWRVGCGLLVLVAGIGIAAAAMTSPETRSYVILILLQTAELAAKLFERGRR